MADQRGNRSGRFLYAVVAGSGEGADGLLGIDGRPVYAISDGEIAAVVGDVLNRKIRPERRHLAAHQEVLKWLMKEKTVLPMRFGIIADSQNAVERVLSRNREVFLKQLGRVAGKVEMGLRVTWDVPNIFEYFVSTHAELRAARDRFLVPGRNPSLEDKIEVGRRFDRILNEDRDAHARKVEEVLSPHCFEIKRNRCRDEREVMNLACLVGRGAQKEFEAGVFEAAKLFDNNYMFDYNGPWAPYNFVEMNLML